MRNQYTWPTVVGENKHVAVINKQQLWDIYNLLLQANAKLKTVVQVNKQFLSEKLLADISLVVQNNAQTVEE